MFIRAFSMLAMAAGLVLLTAGASSAQDRGRGAGPAAAPTGRAAATKDFAGTWVSVVTEHWHLRMLMPSKGDYSMLPLNPAARTVADAWDPARDRTEGNECKSYGAANIMKVPGRFRIQWADDNTLQMDIDSGTQTRQLRFGAGAPAPTVPASWQGYSVASWDVVGGRGGGRPTGQLRVTTTRLRPGYLRKNGVPYSENARLDEVFETFTDPAGETWLTVTSIVTDPTYLNQPYVTTYPFKRIPDRQGWDPTPCRVDEPR